MSTSDMTDTPAVRRPPPGDVATLTAMEGLAALERGALSCEAWTRACLERIEQRNGQVQAWVQVDAHGAGARPRMGPPRTPALAGRRAAGHQGHDRYRRPADGAGRSRDFPGRQPDADAPVVSQARALGFNVLGKNTVSRHAIMLPGPARNPHDLTRTPAASSAGSAAAVADFMAPLSVGTQTAGSILRPSAFCGAVGFKPTLDAIPYVGIRRYSRPLDVIGPIARSVADAALFMRAFTGDPVTTRNRRCATISASACGAPSTGPTRSPACARPSTVISSRCRARACR